MKNVKFVVMAVLATSLIACSSEEEKEEREVQVIEKEVPAKPTSTPNDSQEEEEGVKVDIQSDEDGNVSGGVSVDFKKDKK